MEEDQHRSVEIIYKPPDAPFWVQFWSNHLLLFNLAAAGGCIGHAVGRKAVPILTQLTRFDAEFLYMINKYRRLIELTVVKNLNG